MTKEITNIVNGLIDKIDNTMLGTYDVTTGRTLVCDTKWSRVGKTVLNQAGDVYTISEVSEDLYIVAQPLDPSSPNLDGIISLTAPFYISGTKMATNREWTISTNDMTKKTPLAWLLELIRITKPGRESVIEFDTSLRLFFLDETDITNYYTKDHRDNVVEPMSKLAGAFMQVIEDDRQFETIESYELITFSRFGVETDRGMFENILDANLSGVELRVDLKKYKQNCRC